jgi:anaerobic selenocysteine-containing dehydrogenase
MPTRKVTFCRICEASCGLIAEVEGDHVLRIAPDPHNVVSRGFACIKGVRYGDVQHSDDRLLTPHKRVERAGAVHYEPISWEQALTEIGAKVRELREKDADSVGVYIGNPAAFSLTHIQFAGALGAAFKTRHVYSAGSQDCNNKFVVSEEMFGAPMMQPIPDVDNASMVMMLGTNPAISQLSFAHLPRALERLKAVEKRGGRVVFVNPRRIESAAQVGELVLIRPGSDVFFCLAFAQEVLARKTLPESLAKHVAGYAELRSFVEAWTPERVERVTGIAADSVRELATAYCAARGAVLYAGTGVNQGPAGTLAVWLLHAISIVSGNMDRRGGMLITKQMRAAVDMNPNGAKIKHHYSRVGNYRSVLDSLPAGIMPDEIFTEGPGQLRGLIVSAGNPILSCPNSDRMQAALGSLDLLVSIDLFRNETGNLAHYLLPATTFLERGDLPLGVAGYQPVPYLQYSEPVLQPRGECKDEWWIFSELARHCGVHLADSQFIQAWLNLSTPAKSWLPRKLRLGPGFIFASLAWLDFKTLGMLKKNPHGVLLPAPKTGRFFKRGVYTKSRQVQLAPPRLLADAERLPALLARMSGNQQLRLIGKRERRSHNSWMHNVRSLLDQSHSTNFLYMHPSDAAERGIRDRQLCQVSSSTGQVQVPVKLTEELIRGTVALPHGWGHQTAQGLTVASKTRGVNSNVLAPDGPAQLEALSGMARLTAVEVQVSAYDANNSRNASSAEVR